MKKYQILSNIWRPQTFNNVLGQKYIINAIKNGLDTGRIHQTWLFSGKHGIGKTTIARILAKSLNCLKGVTSNPCRSCSHCIDIEKGKFLDFIELDAASRTKVEEIKVLLETIQYSPIKGRFKVYLIDEVHMLSRHSFNALLKTLEEPPKFIKFILATTEPEKIPSTIISRCLHFPLQSIKKKDIVSHLSYILKRKINTPLEVLNNIANNSYGSIRDSLNMLELAISSTTNNEITISKAAKLFGFFDKNIVLTLVKNILNKNIKNILKLIDDAEKNNISYDSIMLSLIKCFHKICILQILPKENYLNNKKKSTYKYDLYQISQKISFNNLNNYYKILINGRKNLKYTSNTRIILEMTIFEICHK
ncbi:DNA polymerase III gamma and tau subunits [Buchnera aphidicola (Cinara tujafilina)]|uniref:DNA polymerase III subunit gamma/tau n=1 Tax=Buchnera aphidicola (Cinara tujafilina) TaxID=261317 RepID=F7WZL4_9GAMM|nr:DNA polymerase III subunit gamma/tau [Buchnera aphidicola]AEH39881.1 DNA polymerase III gamma and tau subunits [Buchnera aphidicola (Cinara tujafilina)]